MAFLKTNGPNLYYEVKGKGEPLMLLNGLGCDTRTMEPLAERLKISFTVINPDMRCAGQSDKPDTPFTLTDVADEALCLIEHLGHKKINILGFSMGGMAAMELFRRNKAIINNMCLVSTTPSFKRPFAVPKEMLSILRSTEISNALLKQVYGSMFGSRFRDAHPLEEYIRLRMEDTNPQPLHAYLRQLNACEAFDAFDRMKNIDVPVLLVAGNEDRLIPNANSEWLHKNIAGSRIHILKGVGHMAPIEASDELAAAILSSFSQ